MQEANIWMGSPALDQCSGPSHQPPYITFPCGTECLYWKNYHFPNLQLQILKHKSKEYKAISGKSIEKEIRKEREKGKEEEKRTEERIGKEKRKGSLIFLAAFTFYPLKNDDLLSVIFRTPNKMKSKWF